MGKLIVHIGPPKTGTTSLQYWFQNNAICGLKYLGTNQPREEKSLCSRLYNSIFRRANSEDIRIELIKELDTALLENEYVIISEEKYLMESFNYSIEHKLRTMFDIIGCYNPKIIMGYRDAQSVFVSYFVEIYSSLPQELQNDFGEFIKSDYCRCFRYQEIFDMATKIGFSEFSFFSFEKLVEQKLNLEEILGVNDSEMDIKIILPMKNETVKSDGNLIGIRKGKVEMYIQFLMKYVPVMGIGLGIKIKKIFSSRQIIKLTKLEVSEETVSQYNQDLNFILNNSSD